MRVAVTAITDDGISWSVFDGHPSGCSYVASRTKNAASAVLSTWFRPAVSQLRDGENGVSLKPASVVSKTSMPTAHLRWTSTGTQSGLLYTHRRSGVPLLAVTPCSCCCCRPARCTTMDIIAFWVGLLCSKDQCVADSWKEQTNCLTTDNNTSKNYLASKTAKILPKVDHN